MIDSTNIAGHNTIDSDTPIENRQEDSSLLDTYYKQHQYGCFWIWVLFTGFLLFLDGITTNWLSSIIGIFMVLISCAQIWTQVEDKGDYLLVTYGPCRWILCGMGKEKIYYDNIHKYTETRSCMYGAGIPHCSGVKLFNTCSCCCRGIRCCGHKIIRLTIDERMQAFDAFDMHYDCCWESLCFNTLCGKHAEYVGKGCCCQKCFNPCNNNCCAMNQVYISTNDMEGLMRLLDAKCSDGSTVVTEYPLI